MSPVKDRIGKFEIERSILEDHPDIARRVISEVVILRAEALFHKKAVEYIGRCESFDELPDCQDVPYYDVEYDPVEDTVTWVRRQD